MANAADYVSSMTKDVYSIFGLPEEVISVLFAYASRSPYGFRENLQKMLDNGDVPVTYGLPEETLSKLRSMASTHSSSELGENVRRMLEEGCFEPIPLSRSLAGTSEKARTFHEKWTVGYGHASVAEHTALHIGIENISRLASEHLELADPYLSFTEYSQRYQQPAYGRWVIPPVGDYKPEVHDFFCKCYDMYRQALDQLTTYLLRRAKDLNEDQAKRKAGEEARYLLPLAMKTTVGMSGNARAIANAIERLWQSNVSEVKGLAEGIYEAASYVSPTLVRHPDRSKRTRFDQKEARWYFLQSIFNQVLHITSVDREDPLAIVTPRAALSLEHLADGFDPDQLLDVFLAYVGESHGKYRLNPFSPVDERRNAVQTLLKNILCELNEFDEAPDAFKRMTVKIDWVLSESTWHQLLRHRQASWSAMKPNPSYGFVVPILIYEADQDGVPGPLKSLRYLQEKSHELFTELMTRGYHNEAAYVVLNTSARRVCSSMSLYQLFHLTRLRTGENVQHEIKSLCHGLVDQLSGPAFLGQAGATFQKPANVVHGEAVAKVEAS